MTVTTLIVITKVFDGSDGDATRRLYDRLDGQGPTGTIAKNLFRAAKTSHRAKHYRGRRFRSAAYDTKGWSLDQLCALLAEHAADASIPSWGWLEDDEQPVHRHVLYVDLPSGQVSFHTGLRGKGPDYNGAWDGITGQQSTRILRWAAALLDGRPMTSVARRDLNPVDRPAPSAVHAEQMDLL